jgi:NAD(P)-dependent dehydrogenase (short-subunit alcohol dehydrogenase family)
VTSQPAAAPGGTGEALSRLFDVRDRVVLVTGGASGLGLAISTALAGCGATVIVADRDEAALADTALADTALADTGLASTELASTELASTELASTELASTELASTGRAEHTVVDVSDPAAVTGLVDGIIARHGRLDAAFANAGIARGRGPNHAGGDRRVQPRRLA